MKYSLDSYFALNSLAFIATIAAMIALLIFGITVLLLYLRLRKQLTQTLQASGEQFHSLDHNPQEMVDSISAGMGAERLRLSNELAGVAVWEFDSAESRLSRTPNHDALYGLEQNNDSRIDRFLEATHPDDRERYQQIIYEAVLPGGPDNYSFDFRVIWPDKSIHWLTNTGEVSKRDEDGVGVLIRGCLIDITERKQAEDALLESEKRYRLIYDNSLDAILLTAPDGRILSANAAATEMFQMTEEEICQAGRRGLVDSEDTRLSGYLEERASTQQVFGELNLLRKDGTKFLAEFSSTTFMDRYGEQLSSMIIRDISERKEAEERLIASEKRFRALFEQSGDYCLILDPNTADGIPIIVDANQAAWTMHGYTREEFIGKSIADIDVDKEAWQAMNRTHGMMSGFPFFVETTHIRKDGTTFPVAVHGNRIEIEGETPLIFATEYDITKRKQADEALRENEERLRLSTEMAGVAVWEYDLVKSRVARSANHDRLYGLEPQPDMQAPDYFEKYTHPDDLELPRRVAADCIRPDGPDKGSADYRVIWPDGTIHWLTVMGEVAERDEDGNGIMIRGCVIDITERKQVEEALRESEERLRLSTDMAGVAVWEYHFAEDRMIRTDNHDRLYGVEPQDSWGFEDFLDHIHPDDQERASQVIQEAVGPGGSGFSSFDYRVIWPDGTLHWLALIGEVTERDENGVGTVVRGCLIDITQRKLAEEALRLKEANLLEAQEIALLGNWEMDASSGYIAWSDNVYEYFGIEQPEAGLALETFMGFVHPDDQAALYALVESVSTNPNVQFEYRFIRPDGEMRWFAGRGKTEFDEVGAPVRMFGILQDITERKLVEEALRLSEASLREAQEIANLGNWEFDVATTLITGSNVNDRIYGIETPAEGFTYEWFLGLVHPDDRALVNEFRDALASDGSAHVEYRAVRPDGEIRWIAAEGKTTLDESGSPVRMYGVLQDITERKLADEALRTSEERFRGLYEQSPIAVQVYNKEGLLVDVNQRTLELFGINSIKYILGFNMWTDPNLTPDAIETLQNGKPIALAGVLDFDIVKAAELFPTTKSGIMHVDMHVTPLTLNDEIAGYLVQMVDETERKQMEERLLQAQKMESIGRLAGGIAHDFNNILVPIMGYVELGIRTMDPTQDFFPYLQRIRQAADRAAGLTRQILAFSRQQVLEMQVLDLNQVVTNFESFIKRLIGEDIVLQTFLEPELYRVNADAGQIEQVLMNLAINARDAMPSGGNLTIETANVYLGEDYVTKYAGSQPPGPYVMVAISDTGHGMDEETQLQIFDPFFTTKSQGEGTGLGLSTVFGIIKQHGGNIWVYSELEKGATFKIYLPRIEGDSLLTEELFSLPDSNNGAETVLVVEDEEMVRQLVCETLAAYGYHVLEAQSPTDALRIVTEQTDIIHLLLTDVIMPEMNGKELYQKIAAIDPHIKVLYMSGYTDNVIVHHGILDKGVNFLQKPFTIQDLTEKIKQVLTADKA